MIKIKKFEPLKDFILKVVFDDNKTVLYDVKEDMQTLPGYGDLAQPGLFTLAQLDPSRTCIYWNDYIDLPSDTIYEYGTVTAGGI